MNRISNRPTPLDFLTHPSHPSTLSNGRIKDIGVAQFPALIPSYIEAPLRDGLRTPPADDMNTAYQQSQHSISASRQANAYPTPAPSGGNGGNGIYSNNLPQRPYHYALAPPPPTSSLRNDLQPSRPLYQHPTSPTQISKLNNVPAKESPPRKTVSNDSIIPNLQIPASINNSGGSLAEFAAQVSS